MNKRLDQIKNDYNKFATSEQYGTLLPLGNNSLESIEYLLRIAEAARAFLDSYRKDISESEYRDLFWKLQQALEGEE